MALIHPPWFSGPEPGLTRDSVHASMTHNGIHVDLIDTAGWVGVTSTSKCVFLFANALPFVCLPCCITVYCFYAPLTSGGIIHTIRRYDDVGGALADMARRETARALASAHVAVLVLDAERAVHMQRVGKPLR